MKFWSYILNLAIILATVQGQVEEIHTTVGVAFCQKIQSLEFLKDHAGNIYYELLTEDKKTIFSNTWLKYKWASNEIYGFPLDGNEGVSTYFIRVLSNSYRSYRELKVFVTSPFVNDLHEIKVCTRTLSAKNFMNRLDTRYALVKILADRLMETKVENIRIKEFTKNCFKFSFLHIDNGKKCNHGSIQKLRDRLFDDESAVSQRFKMEMSILMDVTSVNITLYGDCKEKKAEDNHFELKWLKTVAPIVVLAAIIGIPVCIACYVGRGVQRRQRRMLREQDKFLKEEEKRRLARMKEYQEACSSSNKESFDSGISESHNSQQQLQPRWNNAARLNGEKNIFDKLVDQYMPRTLVEKYRKRRSSNNVSGTSMLNPLHNLLDIRTQRDKERLKEVHRKKENPRQGQQNVENHDKSVKEDLTQQHMRRHTTTSCQQQPSLFRQHRLISLQELKRQNPKEDSQYRKIFDQLQDERENNKNQQNKNATNKLRQDRTGKKMSLPERLDNANMSKVFNWRLANGNQYQHSPARNRRKVSMIDSMKSLVFSTNSSDIFDSNGNIRQDAYHQRFESNYFTPIMEIIPNYLGNLEGDDDVFLSPLRSVSQQQTERVRKRSVYENLPFQNIEEEFYENVNVETEFYNEDEKDQVWELDSTPLTLETNKINKPFIWHNQVASFEMENFDRRTRDVVHDFLSYNDTSSSSEDDDKFV